jgi:hypothetical protein
LVFNTIKEVEDIFPTENGGEGFTDITLLEVEDKEDIFFRRHKIGFV